MSRDRPEADITNVSVTAMALFLPLTFIHWLQLCSILQANLGVRAWSNLNHR